MAADQKDEEEIFHAVIARPASERAAYLRMACGDDGALRAQLEMLLQAYETHDDFLEVPLVTEGAILDMPPIDEGSGTVIGRYKLLEKIGEGGMAVVYMAEQQRPIRRKVALKIIKLGMDTRHVIARFEAERQALAMMDHPSIAKVLDAGATETGRPYFVMELVQGVSITEYCDKKNLSTKDRLGLFLQVCNAVQHAHQKGIIHRDLKPSNVMVTHHDGKPVPKVIDFGIAKATNQRLTEKTLFTRYAHIIGTPAYMSPEQAELTDLDIDTRTDIYSLGVLLYELLTGTTPFSEEELRKAGYMEMQRVIREQEPVRPSTKLSTLGETSTEVAERRGCTPELLRKAIRGDLDWIVMKSLEKDRARRYETANGLAMDIERHLHNEPVLARSPSVVYRFRKLVQRNKGVFAGTAAVAMALMVGLAVSVVSLVAEHRARQLAVAAQEKEAILRQEAEARELYTRRLAYASDMRLVHEALAGNDLGQALRLLEAHRPAPGQVDLRGWEWRYLWQECRSDAIGELCRYSMAYSVAYSPDGELLAAWRSPGHLWEIWDLSSRQGIRLLPREAAHLVAFSPHGDLLVTDTKKETGIQLWRTGTWEPVEHLAVEDEVRALKFSPDGTRLASVSCPNDLIIWAIDQRPVVAHLHIRGVRPVLNNPHHKALDFSPDGKAVVVGERDGGLRVFDLASGSTDVNIPRAHPGPISALAWSPDPDDPVIASNGSNIGGTIRLWDAVTGNERGSLEGHTAWISTLIFSADGRRLYSASGDQTIRIWDVRQQRCLATLRGCSNEIYGMALAPDGRTLVSADRDGLVAFWNAHPRPREEQPKVIPSDIYAWPAFAPDSRLLAAPRDGIVRLFDLATLEEIERLPELGNDVTRVAYSPDGALLVSNNGKGTVRVWSCVERRLLGQLDDAHNRVGLLGFPADGAGRFALARPVSGKTQVIWWDPFRWQAVRAFELEVLWQGRVSQDGCLLAVYYGDHAGLTTTVHWLSAETGRVLAPEIKAHRQAIQWLAFSADGLQAASTSMDGTVTLYDVPSFERIASFQAHMNSAGGVAFSPDGLRLATSGSEWAVKLWDLSTRRELMTLPGQGLIRDVAFSPDSQWLITLGTEGQLHLWHAPSWEEIEAAESRPADIGQGSVVSVADFTDNGTVQGKEE